MSVHDAQPGFPVPLEANLCFSVYSAGLAFTRLYQPLLADLGLTYPQYLVMVALWGGAPAEAPAPTVNELGRRLRLKSNTLTPMLKRLEARGWIRRERAVDDERNVRVVLTDEGWRRRDEARGIPECLLTALGLESAAAEDLRRRISELRDRLETAEIENLETTR